MIPKFRAWNKENDRMVYPSTEDAYFELTDDDGIVILDLSIEPFDNVFAHIDAVVMQSTGLKDKNGVEVYEGDILLHTSRSINYGGTYWHSYVTGISHGQRSIQDQR